MPTLRRPDVEIHYEVHGDGPPVVLLHGLGSSTEDWEPQLTSLSPRYRTIAIDMRGSGRSRDLAHPGGPFSVAMFARDVATVIEEVVAAPADIIGFSMGGAIAFQLALDYPHAVRTLTIINSGPSLVARTWQERAVIATRSALARAFGPASIAKLLAPRLFPHSEQLRRAFVTRVARNNRHSYAATQRALTGFDVSGRISAIEVPVLVVASDQDYWPVARKHEYARQMRDARVVVVPDSRHALPIEAPERLQPILDAFLAERRGADHVASR